jgi:hypothetical protein
MKMSHTKGEEIRPTPATYRPQHSSLALVNLFK